MPRKPRSLSSTGIYHTILRSVNQHLIFEEDSDYQKFLFILKDCKEKYSIDIYAYCLMDNHIHLLIKSAPETLSSFFQSLGTRFVQWYNNKYSRYGHLFQDRFYSQAVENESHFLSALVYIHNNPVKSNMCRHPSEYRFSSFNAYYGAKNPLVNVAAACDIIGSRDLLLRYFANNCDQNFGNLFADDYRVKKHFTTDDEALILFRKITHLNTLSEASALPRVQRNEFVRKLKDEGLTMKQIARLLDISTKTVSRLCKMSTTPRP